MQSFHWREQCGGFNNIEISLEQLLRKAGDLGSQIPKIFQEWFGNYRDSH